MTLSDRHETVTKVKSKAQSRYLSRISFSKGEVKFNYAFDRLEGEGLGRLTGIHVFGNSVGLVDRYDIHTSYFNSGDSFFDFSTYDDKNGTCDKPECYRLKLDAIDRIDGHGLIRIRQFEYSNDKVIDDLYGYDPFELPPRNSNYTDHWGFSSTGNHQAYNSPYPMTVLEGDHGSYEYRGVDKSSVPAAKSNILTRVEYPTGGFTTIEYGIHSKGGGVRVESLQHFDENEGLVSGSSYEYQEPQFFELPQYYLLAGVRVLQCGGPVDDPDRLTRDQFTLFSSAQNALFDQNGASIGYSRVVERIANQGGRVEHYFLNFSDREEPEGTKYKYSIDKLSDEGNRGSTIAPNKAPFSPRSLLYYDRGVEHTTKIFDDASNLVSEIVHFFTSSSPITFTQKNVAISGIRETDTHVTFNVSEYDIVGRPVRLDSTISTAIEVTGAMSTTGAFKYHQDYPSLLSSTKRVFPDGRTMLSDIRYVQDILVVEGDLSTNDPEIIAFSDMGDVFNAIGIPIENISSQSFTSAESEKIISASITTFKSRGSFIVPQRSFVIDLATPANSINTTRYDPTDDRLVLDPRYRLVSTVEEVDEHGNVLRRTGPDGLPVIAEYDEAGNYLVASTTNNFTTTYTHNPLIGLESTTGPNGLSTSYEYDNFNRLKLVRDFEGNIVEHHEFNFQNEEVKLVPDFRPIGLPLAGQTLHFELIGEIEQETVVTWDLDGDVLVNNDKETSRKFDEPGTYLIKTNIEHPTYGENDFSAAVTIHDTEFDPTICRAATTFDRCASPGNEWSGGNSCNDWSPSPLGLAFAVEDTGGAICFGDKTSEWFVTRPDGLELYFDSGFHGVLPFDEFNTLNGTYQVKCVITTDCKTYERETTFEVIGDCPQE